MVSSIILFDVDGTLLWSGGAGSLAMRRTFQQLYGIEDGFRGVEFSGRTDWAILQDAMQRHGLLDADARSGPAESALPQEIVRFQETYHRLLEPTLYDVKGGRALPGVPRLLAALSAREDVRLGLATGNFREATFIKLRHFGLDGYLSEGGFGDDAEDRGEMVGIAIKRVAGGAPVDRKSVWVIGDTLLDIEAARANGARVLAVATGPCSLEELRTAGADLALEELSGNEAVLAALLG